MVRLQLRQPETNTITSDINDVIAFIQFKFKLKFLNRTTNKVNKNDINDIHGIHGIADINDINDMNDVIVLLVLLYDKLDRLV